MDLLAWGALGALVLVAAWAGWTFNLLIRRRNGVDEARATIGVELTRRHDLVPSLVGVVRGYGDFEESVLTRVSETRARAVRGDLDAVAETTLTDAVHSLLAVAEQYPDLLASDQFQRLQDELALTEDRIAYARAVYNAWVTEYETTRQSFPSSLLANLLRFSARPYFEADVMSRTPAEIALQQGRARG